MKYWIGFLAVLFLSSCGLISNEPLEAFRAIEIGIENSNEIVEKKITELENRIETLDLSDSVKFKLKTIETKSDTLSLFIEEIKEDLISKSGGLDESGNIIDMSNIIVSGEVLVDGEKGRVLQTKILALKELMGEMTANKDIISLNADSVMLNNKKEEWVKMFHHVPVVGTITILTKIENDILNSRSIVLNEIYSLDKQIQLK